MKKLLLSIALIIQLCSQVLGQSMYGDQVKFDVKIKYVYSFEEALTQAKEKNKLIFFNCFADWAVACHSMNKSVFTDQEFADWMDKNFVNFFTDVTKDNGKILAEKYKIQTQAHYLVLNSDGEVVHRIVGGKKIDEFKELLSGALNEKTSLKGMNQMYEKGNRSLPFLKSYFQTLRVAEENEKAKTILDQIFLNLDSKEWSLAENFGIFKYKVRNYQDPYFQDLVANKDKYIRNNGKVEVIKLFTKILGSAIYPYSLSASEYDPTKTLDLFILANKLNIPKEDIFFDLYKIAKHRGDQNLEGILEILNTRGPEWDQNLLRTVDLTLSDFRNSSDSDRVMLTNYWQKRADSFQGSTANHYKQAIKSLNTDSGINFLKISFEEALVMAKKENKLIFLDCYTTWCGPCKWLENNTFREEKVGEYFNNNFINIKIDMEKGEGKELNNRFAVSAYPTMLLINQHGELQKRLMGSMNGTKLLNQIK